MKIARSPLITIFIYIISLLVSFTVLTKVNAAATITPTITPTPPDKNEVVIDANCIKAILEGTAVDSNTNEPICNRYCQRGILYAPPDYITINGQYCIYGTTDKVDFGKTLTMLGPLQPLAEDTVLIYVRGAIYLVMGGSSLAVILYGLYGWYLRAMSEGNPEKVAESIKVYKNAVIGIIIIFSALVITQLLFLFLGITDGPFDFNFIPKAGYMVDVTDSDLGRFCYSNQKDIDGKYKCDPTTNKWTL